jgi:NTP pyrophosphatase (non-canonical NTP hydrolase)
MNIEDQSAIYERPLVNSYQDFTKTTAIYPDAGTGNDKELMYLALGLGEAGEIQNLVKKIYRDNQDDEQVTESANSIAKELGDLCYYIARMADVLGFSMSEILAMNEAKLRSRQERGVLGGSGDER